MGDVKNTTELDEFYTNKEDMNIFRGKVSSIELNHGITSLEIRSFLNSEIEKHPTNTVALHYLYDSYVVGLEIEEAKKVAWKMIAVKDCPYFRSYLERLDNTEYITEQVCIRGDKSKIPFHELQRVNEELKEFFKEVVENS